MNAVAAESRSRYLEAGYGVFALPANWGCLHEGASPVIGDLGFFVRRLLRLVDHHLVVEVVVIGSDEQVGR